MRAHKRLAPQSRPFLQNTGYSRRQPSVDHFPVSNPNPRAEPLIADVEMRRIVIIEEHPDRNTEEIGYSWQTTLSNGCCYEQSIVPKGGFSQAHTTATSEKVAI